MVKWDGLAPHPFFRLSRPNTFAGASGCRCERRTSHQHRTHRSPVSPAQLQIQLKCNRHAGSKPKAGPSKLAGEANWVVRPGPLLPKKRPFLASPIPLLEMPRSFSFLRSHRIVPLPEDFCKAPLLLRNHPQVLRLIRGRPPSHFHPNAWPQLVSLFVVRKGRPPEGSVSHQLLELGIWDLTRGGRQRCVGIGGSV